MDSAYWLWTFQGRLLQKNSKDRFCQLLWRPRPPAPGPGSGQGLAFAVSCRDVAVAAQAGFLPDTVRVTGVELACGSHSKPFEGDVEQ